MRNLYEFIQEGCHKYPYNYYIYDQVNWTYKDVYEYVNTMTTILLEHNIKLDDRVILYVENSIEYIVSYFAVLYMGATVIPITHSSSIESVREIAEDCRPDLVIASVNTYKILVNNSMLEDYIIFKININEIAKTKNKVMQDFATGSLAMIIYTSGTTSNSKGVMLTHDNLIANTNSILDYLNLNSSDSILATLSFTYSYGNSVLLTHTKVGASLYLLKAIYPQDIFTILQNKKITGFSTVGSYLNIMLKQKNYGEYVFSKLRYITLAGEQTASENIIKVKNLNIDLQIFIMYGQTEASARLTYLEPDMLDKKMGSVGKPIKDVKLRIINMNGEEAKPKQAGEIVVKGPNIMLGYLNKYDETAKVLKDGWLYTGDIGYLDSDGFLYITGRKNDIIKYLGYRISPIEIENHINMNDRVTESAVIECHINNETKIAAVLVTKENFNREELIRELKKKLPIYKVPSVFQIVDNLPKTSNGKIKRKEIKNLFKKINGGYVENDL